MDFQLGPEIITSYKRLSYTAWYALAEFVDNSTQAYFNNKSVLDKVYKEEKSSLTVEITVSNANKGSIIIKDNSIGMSENDLTNAVVVGRRPKDDSGRSKYGLGLKTAACWFGDYWTIETKKLGELFSSKVIIDVDKISKGNVNLNYTKYKSTPNEHYTKITITKLHREIHGRTNNKIKNYLSSMYRVDFKNYKLKLIWQGDQLKWNESDLEKRILRNQAGELEKRQFKFKINKKLVHGWAAVFETGSRRDAGFSIIQSDRVIVGWPDSYRPETLFGNQEGGVNDLVNQRLFGEIYLEGFDVSHTKDEILFTDEESEALDSYLLKQLADLKELAKSYRKYSADERITTDDQTEMALNIFNDEIKSPEMQDLLKTIEIPPIDEILRNKEILKKSVLRRNEKPSLKAKINDLIIKIYIVDDMSPNDPYVLIEATANINSVLVIINKAHPHWLQIKNEDGILNFIRHCVYDGVAEWKAYFKTNKLEPDTIKLIKDNLLRIPFEIENKR
jgi:hypothetical protein